MTSESNALHLNASFDRALAWTGGGSCRYFVAEVAATGTLEAAEHRPHNLALAIDVSASGADHALSALQEFCKSLIKRLGGADKIAIVSFADEPRTELGLTALDEAGKKSAVASIDALEPRAGCDFTEGWLAASECAALAANKDPSGPAHVIIVSDGRADRGLRRAEVLARHAAELRSRGISTAAVPATEDADMALLLAIDDPRGPADHYIGILGDDAIHALVTDRLEIAPVVARDVQMALTVPAQTLVSELGGAVSSEIDGSNLVCSLGSLRASGRRTIVIKTILAEAEVGSTAEFTVELSWTDGSGRRQKLDPVPHRLVYARGRENTPQPRDLAATLTVITHWRHKLLWDLINLNRRGQLREAEAHLASELKFLERYAHGVPEAEPLLGQLRVALPMVHQPWRDRHASISASRI